MLFLSPTCSVSVALLLCVSVSFSFYVYLFVHCTSSPVPCPFLCLLAPFSPTTHRLSRATVDCSASHSSNSGTREKKDVLPSSSNYKNPEMRPFYLSLQSQGQGTVPQWHLGAKLEGNSNSLNEGRSSSRQKITNCAIQEMRLSI